MQVSVEAAALVKGGMLCPKDWVGFEDQRDLPSRTNFIDLTQFQNAVNNN